jgi:hypothetical protein
MTDLSTIIGNPSANITITPGTEAERLAITNPQINSIFYQTNGINPGIYVYNGSQWAEKGGISDISNLITGTISKERLPDSGITPNTYTKITVDPKGRAIAGANPTTLAGYGIADAAQLDNNGKLPLSTIPSSVVGAQQYKGFWDANTNTPTLTNGIGTNGFFYMVTANGNTNLEGTSTWIAGDLVIFDGIKWNRVPDVATQMFNSLIVGDTTSTTMPNDRVIFTNNGKLKTDINLAFTNNTLTTNKLAISSAESNLLELTNKSSAGANLSLTTSKNLTDAGIVKDTEFGKIIFNAWNGTNVVNGSSIVSQSTELWNTGNGTQLGFYVTKNTTSTPFKALTISNDGSLEIKACIKETVHKITGNSLPINLSNGSTQKLTTGDVAMSGGIGSVSITLPTVTELEGKSITIIVQYTGVHGINWVGPIRWAEGVEPVPTAIDGKIDIFTFYGDGDVIYGGTAGQAY